MSNFFLKIRKLESKLWKSFLLCGTSSSSSLHLGRIIWVMILSLLCVSESTTAKLGNVHQHCSVKRVMVFNGISPLWTGVKYSAGNTYFQGWKIKQKMAGSAPEHVLDCVGAACCPCISFREVLTTSDFGLAEAKPKTKLEKFYFFFLF